MGRKKKDAEAVAVSEPPAERPCAEPLKDLGLVAIDKVAPDPENPRSRISQGLDELAQSIRAHGILNPITVVANGQGYTVLAGHRRLEAARRLGLTEVPCRQYIATPSRRGFEEVAARVVENDQRLPLDPLAEGKVVRDLLAAGLGTEQVVFHLGRSEAWVRRRVGLLALSPRVLKGEQFLEAWPVTWLEDLASLPQPLQDELLEKGRLDLIRTREQLQATIFEESTDLGAAPWDLGDAELVPKAGSCEACPKRSARAPGLFDLVERKDGVDRCLDGLCYGGKFKAWRELVVKAAKAKHPDLLQVHGAPATATAPALVRARGKVLEDFDFVPVKAGAKGARAAIVVDGKRAGSIMYVRPKARRAAEAPTNGAVEKAEKTLEPAALRKLRALARATADVAVILQELAQPASDTVVVMLVAYGLELGQSHFVESVRGKGDSRQKRLARSGYEALGIAWSELQQTLVNGELSRSAWPEGTKRWAADVAEHGDEAELLATYLDSKAPKDAGPFNWPEILKRATEVEERSSNDGAKK